MRYNETDRETIEKLEDTTVYRLVGDDILSMIYGRNRRHISSEELKDMVEFVADNIEIPWADYVECVLDMYDMMREG